MRKVDVDERLASTAMSVYMVARTVTTVTCSFEVVVDMPQGSALRQLLFVMVTEAISSELRLELGR